MIQKSMKKRREEAPMQLLLPEPGPGGTFPSTRGAFLGPEKDEILFTSNRSSSLSSKYHLSSRSSNEIFSWCLSVDIEVTFEDRIVGALTA